MKTISARRETARANGAADYEQKRVEILQVAAMVFRENGFEGATMDEIAGRMNMTRAALYYYFKSKQELFRDMVGDATTGNVIMAEMIARSADDPATKLRALITGLFESYAHHYPYMFAYLQEDMNRLLKDKSEWGNRILALNRRFDVAVKSIVREGLDKGVFRSKGEPSVIVAGVIGMCNWSHRWYNVDGPLSAREIATIFSDMILDGLQTEK